MTQLLRTFSDVRTTSTSSVWRKIVPVLAFVLPVFTLALVPTGAQAQNTFTVNSTGDGIDDDTNDNTCATSSGDCTLRAAIQQANATVNVGGLDQIQFDIPGSASPSSPHVIQPGSELPEVTNPVVIDGSTEPDYGGTPVVELDGQNAGSSAGTGLDGLTMDVIGSTIHALAVINFDDDGIDAFQPNSSSNVTVTGCHLGVRADGVTVAGNGRNGISGGAPDQLGGTGTNEGNIIGGNDARGISTGPNNTIEGNFIGTNPGGDDLGNGAAGIRLNENDDDVAIGGTSTGAANVIGFNNDGIVLSGANNTTVRGNYIGTNASGDQLPHVSAGIELEDGSSANQIGGTAAGAGNVIGNNFGVGVRIRGSGTTGNSVTGNFVGTDPSGSELGNPGDGIRLASGAMNNLIGGMDSGAGNVISDNQEAGITITGAGTSDNAVEGNFIGTNANGTAVLGNDGSGISVETDATSNTIGDTDSGAGNVIAGNDRGLFIGTSDNVVQGNFIGTNSNGANLGTNAQAIEISDGSGTLIGGSLSGAGNVLGNAGNIAVVQLGTNSSNATLLGNFIGTNANGDDLGSTADGIVVAGTGHTIGGTGAGEANTIANNETGVNVIDGTGHTVRGNSIFDNATLGLNLGNSSEVTDNDAGDTDDGQNRLQNFPEIQSADYDAGTGDVTVTYLVDSDPSASGSGTSTYPLQVDLYKADGNTDEGRAYLGTDTYSSSSPNDYGNCGSPPCSVTITFAPPSGVTLSQSDHVVATATDDNGNTSEFSGQSAQLPVELASFKGTQTERGVRLTWATASETNNAGFRVEHREPKAPSWSKIGFVEGSGTTSKAQSYRFTAEDRSVGTHRFRLVQVDLDGSTHFHEPVTVELQMTQALRLSAPAPNPTQGLAKASFAVKDASKTSIALYNVLGEKMATLYRGTPTAGEAQSLRVRTSDLASGVYFIRLQADGQSTTRRLAVVR